jgi:RNA polymerase sigma-70 factor (ECF subfamily)
MEVGDTVTELFELLREPLYRYLTAVFGDPAAAEDITQEVVLRLYRVLHAGQAVANVRCWAFRVAHNVAVNQRKHDQFMAPLDGRSWEDVCATLADTSLDPEQQLLREERFRQIHAALGRLTLPERQCLFLRAEGLRYREIADVLGVGVPTVNEYLRRAIKKLSPQHNA